MLVLQLFHYCRGCDLCRLLDLPRATSLACRISSALSGDLRWRLRDFKAEVRLSAKLFPLFHTELQAWVVCGLGIEREPGFRSRAPKEGSPTRAGPNKEDNKFQADAHGLEAQGIQGTMT